MNHTESEILRRMNPRLRAEVDGLAGRLAAKVILNGLPTDSEAEDHRLDLAEALKGAPVYCLYCTSQVYALGLCHRCYRRFRRLMKARVVARAV